MDHFELKLASKVHGQRGGNLRDELVASLVSEAINFASKGNKDVVELFDGWLVVGDLFVSGFAGRLSRNRGGRNDRHICHQRARRDVDKRNSWMSL